MGTTEVGVQLKASSCLRELLGVKQVMRRMKGIWEETKFSVKNLKISPSGPSDKRMSGTRSQGRDVNPGRHPRWGWGLCWAGWEPMGTHLRGLRVTNHLLPQKPFTWQGTTKWCLLDQQGWVCSAVQQNTNNWKSKEMWESVGILLVRCAREGW